MADQTMTWIDVASDAVKIGLGAAIAGGWAFLRDYQTNKHQSRSEYVTRRRDGIEKIAQTFEQLYQSVLKRGTYIIIIIESKNDQEKDVTRRQLNKLDADNPVMKQVMDFHAIEAQLNLYDLDTISKKVALFRYASNQFDENENSDNLRQRQQDLWIARDEILSLLAKAFRA